MSIPPDVPRAGAERRCWRCLQVFPGDAVPDGPAGAEFWLCGACEAALLPSKHRAT